MPALSAEVASKAAPLTVSPFVNVNVKAGSRAKKALCLASSSRAALYYLRKTLAALRLCVTLLACYAPLQ